MKTRISMIGKTAIWRTRTKMEMDFLAKRAVKDFLKGGFMGEGRNCNGGKLYGGSHGLSSAFCR